MSEEEMVSASWEATQQPKPVAGAGQLKALLPILLLKTPGNTSKPAV